LVQLIAERAKAAQAEEEPLDQWEAAKLARQEQQHNQQRWEWVRYHNHQAATHHAIAAEHAAKAKLLEGNDA
jgi:uncharacterized protein (DUF3084 family)